MTQIVRGTLRFVEARERAVLLTLCVLVFVLGGIYAVLLGDQLPYIDEHDYHILANNIAFKQSYVGGSGQTNGHRAPGYPFVLAALVFLGAGIPFLRLLNFAALAGTVYLVYLTVRHSTSPFGGVAAAALVVGYPVLFYAAGTLFPQTLAGFLFVVVLCMLSRVEALPMRLLVFTGLVFGYLILTVPIFAFALGVVVCWLRAIDRRGWLKRSLAIVLPALLLTSAWSARNYAVFGSFAFVSTSTGATLLYGNSEETTIDGGSSEFLLRHYAEADALGLNEAERDHYLTKKAIRLILDNKARTFRLYVLKVLNHFNFRNEHYARSEASGAKDAVILLTYGPLLLLFALRLARVRRYPLSRFEALLAVLYVASAFVYAVFHTRIRYRLPFDLALIIMVAMFLDRVMRRLVREEQPAVDRMAGWMPGA